MTLRNIEVIRFTDKIDQLISNHDSLIQAISQRSNRRSLESYLVVKFALQSAVLWESFIHDLVLAYVEMDPKRALKNKADGIVNSIKDKFGSTCSRNTEVNLPQNPNRNTLAKIIDHKGRNITFTDANSFNGRINNLISPRFIIDMNLDASVSEFFDFQIALRNYLSHHSTSSRNILKEKIAGIAEPVNIPLNSPLNTIGPYLKSDASAGVTRAIFIANRMMSIARNDL